ncbi:hypothetical protein J437_LFUL015245 [Ladona fulva]|uniref:Reverse transcriptase domain-containing protein n=1 Tax=Ladona fulva TaxID=123851 RepID=A0A8K0KKE2_LADFU|nr:hypothetical protein J437_LFUL015245 [Ladona fulva]
MVRDYLKDRVLMYEMKSKSRTKDITNGVAQGSILGPNFWHALYNRLLRIDMPERTFLVGYADNIAAVIEARNPELAQLQLNQVMRSPQAAATTVSLSRLIANVGGPKQYIRKLFMAVVESKLLHGAEIWASDLNTAKYRNRITAV